MGQNLSYAELDELVHFAGMECDFAERSAKQADDLSELELHSQRYANARYLMLRLEQLRAEAPVQGRSTYLLEGAEGWVDKFVQGLPLAPVVELAAHRRRAQPRSTSPDGKSPRARRK